MYSFKSKVRYSEVDRDGYLSLEAMMKYFQDCSSFHSEDLGVGIDFLKENHLTWMLIAWHVQIFRKPGLGEEITIGTWPYSFRSVRGGRNFVLIDAEGNTIARADSEWVLYNIEQKRIAKVPKEVSEPYTLGEALDMGGFTKIVCNDEELKECDRIVVSPFFLDTNGHVNNVQYLNIAKGYVSDEYNEFRVEYKNQAFLRDEICVYTRDTDGKKQVVLKNQKDELLVNIEFGKME
ncbi:MAG: acyl-[Lachnospiraceae bacterium]|nr:acyl-[acyl-carrier-protein] thioesterase [Lachnospiraceae bacterium]